MDKTLFNPPMIETFRACRRAFLMAFGEPRAAHEIKSVNTLLKRFLLKAIAEINRGHVTTVNQVQKFMGQHWAADQLGADDGVRAFLYAHKVLSAYVNKPYCPEGAQIVGVALKVRARIPHDRVYLEDTFDLIVWHRKEQHLEFVDFHLHPLKPIDQAWPSASILVKQFLAERLHSRWPFEKLSLTFYRLGPQPVAPHTLNLDASIYRLHWPELLTTINEMKDPDHFHPHRSSLCHRCDFLAECTAMDRHENKVPVVRSA